jgi:hypothetical protein
LFCSVIGLLLNLKIDYMKKFVLLTALVASFSLSAVAQRTVSISLQIDEPVAGATITADTPYNYQLTLTNNGPDDIKTTDTIRLMLGINSQYFLQTLIQMNPVSIASGGTQAFTYPNAIISGGTAGTVNGCVFAVVFSRNQSDSINNSATGTINATNCKSYNYVIQSGNPTSKNRDYTVHAFDFELYPNPVQQLLNVDYYLVNVKGIPETVHFEVFNTAGQSVHAIGVAPESIGRNNIQLDLGHLPKGIYFIKMTGGNEIFSGKFIKE